MIAAVVLVFALLIVIKTIDVFSRVKVTTLAASSTFKRYAAMCPVVKNRAMLPDPTTKLGLFFVTNDDKTMWFATMGAWWPIAQVVR